MKKLMLLSFLLVFIAVLGNAQKTKNEAKVNLLGLAIGLPDISYERLLNEKMAVGLSTGMGFKNGKHYQNQYRYVLLPYYKYLFGNKYASGFFLQAHASIISLKKDLKDEFNLKTRKNLNLIMVCYSSRCKNYSLGRQKILNGKYFIQLKPIGYEKI